MLHSAAGIYSGNTCVVGLRLRKRPDMLVVAADHRQTTPSDKDKPANPCDYERNKCLPLVGSAGPIDIDFGSSNRGVMATDRIVLFAVYRTACLSLVKARRESSTQDVTITVTKPEDKWIVDASNMSSGEILEHLNGRVNQSFEGSSKGSSHYGEVTKPTFDEADARFKKAIAVIPTVSSGAMILVCKPSESSVFEACEAALRKVNGKVLYSDDHVKLAVVQFTEPQSFGVIGMAGDKTTTDEMVAESTKPATVNHAGRQEDTMSQKALENTRNPGRLDVFLQKAFRSIELRAKNEKERQLVSTLGRIASISAAFVNDEAVLAKYTLVATQDPKADRPYKLSDNNGLSKEPFVSVGSGAVHAMKYLTENTEKLEDLYEAKDVDDFLLEMYKHVADNVKSVSPSFSRVILIENGKEAEYARVEPMEDKTVVRIYFDEEETPKKAEAAF